MLRKKLPSHKIVCTVSAGYFTGWAKYPKGAFLHVHRQKGSLIDFYNVRYFDQGDSTYSTGQALFNVSTGWAVRTAVNQLVTKGVEQNKIVVGKPAAVGDADAASFMAPADLSAAIAAEIQASGWKTGVMFNQLASDLDGNIMKQVVHSIENP